MRRIVERYVLPRLAVVLLDLGFAVMAFWAALLIRDNLEISADRLPVLLAGTPAALLAALFAFRVAGTHRAIWSYVTLRDLGPLVVGATLAVGGFVAAMFFWDRLASMPRTVPIVQWLLLLVLLCGSRLIYGLVFAERPHPAPAGGQADWEPVLLVGGGEGAAVLTHLLQAHPDSGWRPVGILDQHLTVGRMIGQVPILGGLGDFRRVLARLRLQGMAPARVIVTGPHHLVGLDAVRRLQREAYAERVVVTNLPDLLSFRSGRTDAAAAEARLRQPAFQRPSYALAKRGADIAVAGLGLVLGAPLIAAVALLTAVGVGTPVLFRQARLGRGRRPFVLYKFCTMRELYGEDGRPLPDALRTTAVGRFLRRTRLDEMPQLWNVLVGDMALVGPRPLLARDLATMPDGGRERSGVRPGITGWAQVHGGQLLGGDAKLALDLWYVRHASLGLDARILLLTLRMVLQGDRVDAPAVERAKAFLQSA